MENEIKELIESLEKQKENYATMIRETNCKDSAAFFGGKMAGIFDEIQDLKNLLEQDKTFEVTFSYMSYRKAKFKAKDTYEAIKLAEIDKQINGWDNFNYACVDSNLESVKEVN